MSSRLITDMDERLQVKYLAFAGKMAEVGVPFIVTRTYRSQSEQDELYTQGRTKPGNKVTWIKVSKHSAVDINGKPASKAFDIVIMKERKPTWDLKCNVNDNEIPDYLEAADIGRKIGLRAGADFKDYPHFELREETR